MKSLHKKVNILLSQTDKRDNPQLYKTLIRTKLYMYDMEGQIVINRLEEIAREEIELKYPDLTEDEIESLVNEAVWMKLREIATKSFIKI